MLHPFLKHISDKESDFIFPLLIFTPYGFYITKLSFQFSNNCYLNVAAESDKDICISKHIISTKIKDTTQLFSNIGFLIKKRTIFSSKFTIFPISSFFQGLIQVDQSYSRFTSFSFSFNDIHFRVLGMSSNMRGR